MLVIQKRPLPAFFIIICIWATTFLIPLSSSQSALHCKFNNISLCQWVNVRERWKVTQGSKYGSYGPATDHVAGHGPGYYAIATGNVGTLDNESNILRSPQINVGPSGLCFKFWYYLSGPGQLNLTLSLINPPSKQVLWSRKGPGEPKWTFNQVEVTNIVGVAIFRFEGSPTLDNQANVAVDDIDTVEGACPKRYSCDFENGLCDFHQSTKNDSDWIIDRATEGNNVRPKRLRLDYNYGVRNQYSTWVNFSALCNHQELKFSTLSLPPLKVKSMACLRFWYHISGTAGLSIVHIHKESEGHLNQDIWMKTAKQDEDAEWKLAQIQVNVYLGSNLTFKAIVGAKGGDEDSIEKKGQISVDNVDLELEMCPDIANCHFEDFFCPWQNYITSGDSYWIRTAAGRTSSGASVRADHTFGTVTGNYLLLKGGSSVTDKGVTARLLSPQLKTEVSYCIFFWYLIDGNGIINIRYMYNTTGTLSDSVGSVKGPSGLSWKLFTATSSAVERIVVEGVIDQTQSLEINDILIDDLSLKAGACDAGFNCSNGGTQTTFFKSL